MPLRPAREVAPGPAPTELWRQPKNGPKLVALAITNLVTISDTVNPIEVLILEADASGIGSLRVEKQGSDYESVPAVRLMSGASRLPVLAAAMEVDTIELASRGIYYTVGEVLNVMSGDGTRLARLRVSAVDGQGRVQTVTIEDRGVYTELLPDQRNVIVAGKTGRGLVLRLTYRLREIAIIDSGAGYTDEPKVVIDGTAEATALMSLRPEARHLFAPKPMGPGELFVLKDLELADGDVLAVRCKLGSISARVSA